MQEHDTSRNAADQAESTDEYFAHKFGGPAHVLAKDVRKLKSETIRSTTKVHLIWWYTASFIIT